MLACVDVDYRAAIARGGCLAFAAWTDAAPAIARTADVPLPAGYAPGELYRRELPPILAALAAAAAPAAPADAFAVVIVDGYVWLSGRGPGLGAHLHAALGGAVAVVGVAKTAWSRPAAPDEPADHRVVAVARGGSARPLFVTAAGLDPDDAAAHVAAMHGPHRLPTLLKAVDSLVRRP